MLMLKVSYLFPSGRMSENFGCVFLLSNKSYSSPCHIVIVITFWQINAKAFTFTLLSLGCHHFHLICFVTKQQSMQCIEKLVLDDGDGGCRCGPFGALAFVVFDVR